MNTTALEENIERLTEETRKAKQVCLAFFASMAAGVEELRQMQDELSEAERLVRICRIQDMVDYSEYKMLLEFRVAQQGRILMAQTYVLQCDVLALADKLTKYRDLLGHLNQHQTWQRQLGQVIEFPRDHRRSNHPPTS